MPTSTNALTIIVIGFMSSASIKFLSFLLPALPPSNKAVTILSATPSLILLYSSNVLVAASLAISVFKFFSESTLRCLARAICASCSLAEMGLFLISAISFSSCKSKRLVASAFLRSASVAPIKEASKASKSVCCKTCIFN